MEKLQLFFQTAPVDPTQAGHALWLIIALPLLGAFVSGVFGKIIGRANTNLIAIGAVLGSFLLSLLVFWTINDYRGGLALALRRQSPTRWAPTSAPGSTRAPSG